MKIYIYMCTDYKSFNRLKSVLYYRKIKFKIKELNIILNEKLIDFEKINKTGIIEKIAVKKIDILNNDYFLWGWKMKLYWYEIFKDSPVLYDYLNILQEENKRMLNWLNNTNITYYEALYSIFLNNTIN